MSLLAIDILIKSFQKMLTIDNNSLEKIKNTELNSSETVWKKIVNNNEMFKDSSIFSENNYDMLEKIYETNNLFGKTKCDFQEVKKKEKSYEKKCLTNLILVLQRLTQLCKNQPKNCGILCENNTILKLLYGFESCFMDNKNELSELQTAILELVTILGRHSFTPEDLFIYFSYLVFCHPCCYFAR